MLKQNRYKSKASQSTLDLVKDNLPIDYRLVVGICLLIYFIVPLFTENELVRAFLLAVFVFIMILFFSYNYKLKHGNNLAAKLNELEKEEQIK